MIVCICLVRIAKKILKTKGFSYSNARSVVAHVRAAEPLEKIAIFILALTMFILSWFVPANWIIRYMPLSNVILGLIEMHRNFYETI